MPNNYYTFGGPFIPSTKVRSGQVNPEFAGVESAFDLLPGAVDAIPRGVTELGIDVQGGTVNEFDVAMPDTRLTNQEGDLVVFRATHTNDGPVVINVDTIGDIAAVEFDGSAFAGGELVTGRVYEFRYDNANTQFVLSQSTDGANQVIAAEDWAIRPEDDPIPVSSGGDGVTDFSALHYAAKSAQFGGGLDFFGDHDASGGDPATPATGNPLYRIVTSGGVITGAGQVEIGDDIYWNGVDWNRINNQPGTFTQGSGSDDPTAPGSFDAQFQWQNSLGAPLADVGFNSDQQFALINRVHGGGLRLAGENGAGSLETYLQGSPGAGTLLMFTGLQRFATALDGIIINDGSTNDPTAGGIQDVRIDARNGSFAPVYSLGFTASNSLQLRNLVHGAGVILAAEDSGGVLRNLLSANPLTSVDLYFNGTRIFRTRLDGIELQGSLGNDPAAGGTQDVSLQFENNVGQTAGSLEYASSIDMRLQNRTHGGRVILLAENTAGSLRTLIVADPDAEVGLYRDSAEVARTITAANGGFEVNNTLTGGGFERVLTTADLGGSPFTEIILTNSNALDLVDTNVALNIGAADPDNDPHLELGISAVASELAIQAKATATAVAELEINRLGGNVRVGSQASGVAGGVFLHHSNGAASGPVIETVISGMILEGKSGSSTILDFHEVLGNLAMRVVYNGANFAFEGFVSSEEIRFQSRNSGAAVRELIFMDPDDDVEIYHPATDRVAFRTTALGIDVRSNAADDPTLTLTEDATLKTTVLHDVGTDITILKNEVDSGHVQIRGEDSGSIDTLMAAFDPDGSSELYADGTAHLIVATGSMTFRGGSATTYSGLIQNTAGGSLSTLSISAADWIFSSTVDSVTMALRATNTSSVATTLFLGDPDTDTRLFHQNIATVITLASAAGGLSALNTLTGGGVERVLTQSDDAVTATTAELTAIADAINTAARKVAGFEVFNTTTSIVVWAVGAADGSLWVDATGATAHTPA